MATTQVRASGHMTLRLMQDGSTVAMRFEVKQGTKNASLYQIVNADTGVVVPDWAASPITVKPIAAKGDTNLSLTNHEWYYNGVKITTSTAGFAIAADGTLTINKNLASATNTGNDILQYKGLAALSETRNVAVSHTADIEITQTGSGVYLGVITPAEAFLSESEPTAMFTGKLYLGATEIEDFCCRWKVCDKYINNVPALSLNGSVSVLRPGSNAIGHGYDVVIGTLNADQSLSADNPRNDTVTIGRKNIEGQALLICEFYVLQSGAKVKVESASAIVTDLADDIRMILTSSEGLDVPVGGSTVVTGSLRMGDQPYTPANPKWKMYALRSDSLEKVTGISSTTNTLTVTAAQLAANGDQLEIEAEYSW